MRDRFALAAVIACAGACTSTPESIPVESNAAGITAVQIERSNGHVVVRGLDGSGAMIATALLTVGTVRYSVDDGVTYTEGHGRDLFIQVADEAPMEHASPGEPALDLPIPQGVKKTAAFLALAPLQTAFPGVQFHASAAGAAGTGEVPYDNSAVSNNSTCDPCTYSRNASCGSTACAVASGTSSNEEEFVCCGTSHQAVDRMCTGNPGGTNSCGAVGPAGCAVCWGSSYATYCSISVIVNCCEIPNFCAMQWN